MPDPTVAALFQAFLDWVKAPWKMFTILFVISLSALLAPRSWVQAIGMTAWATQFHPWLVLGCLFCGLFLAITGIEESLKPRFARNKSKRETNEKYSRIERTLRALKADEIGKLGLYGVGHSTQNFFNSDGVVLNLVNKNILYRSTSAGMSGSYCLTPDVTSYLAEKGQTTVSEAVEELKKC